MSSRYASSVALIAFSSLSSLVHAQGGGSLNYGPASQSVPVGSGIWLAILFALLIAAGFTVIRRQKMNGTVGALLVITSALSVISLGMYVQDAGAPPVEVELDNPSGGSVSIPVGYQQYINTSGVALRVNAITEPCNNGINNAQNSCNVSQVLADTDSCETNFACPQPEICDGLDNNFNTQIDEGIVPPLEPVCQGGPPVCTGAGGWSCPQACVSDCSGKACGDDGCGGSCGSCGGGSFCTPEGSCAIP